MKHRHIAIATGIFALLTVLSAWEYFPARADYLETYETSSQNWSLQDLSTIENFLPLVYKNNTTQALSNQIYLPLVLKNYVAPAPLWRFGIAKDRRAWTDYDSSGIASMRFGWYVDFGATENALQPYGMEYIPTIRVADGRVVEGLAGVSVLVGGSDVDTTGVSVLTRVGTV